MYTYTHAHTHTNTHCMYIFSIYTTLYILLYLIYHLYVRLAPAQPLQYSFRNAEGSAEKEEGNERAEDAQRTKVV